MNRCGHQARDDAVADAKVVAGEVLSQQTGLTLRSLPLLAPALCEKVAVADALVCRLNDGDVDSGKVLRQKCGACKQPLKRMLFTAGYYGGAGVSTPCSRCLKACWRAARARLPHTAPDGARTDLH